jgi:hypothetical protein
VYCLVRETWGPFKGVYALDHFLPMVARPDLALEYENLLYGCVSCNLSKGSQAAPDPLTCLLHPVVRVAEDGAILADTPAARKLIELLGSTVLGCASSASCGFVSFAWPHTTTRTCTAGFWATRLTSRTCLPFARLATYARRG